MTVHRERPRQTAAWKKPGHLKTGAVGDKDDDPGFLAFGAEVFHEEHRLGRDGTIPPRLRSAPLGRSEPHGAEAGRHAPKGDEKYESK